MVLALAATALVAIALLAALGLWVWTHESRLDRPLTEEEIRRSVAPTISDDLFVWPAVPAEDDGPAA